MRRDPATRGIAVILFGIAIMVFGATEGPSFPAQASSFAGTVIAIIGLIDALTDPAAKG